MVAEKKIAHHSLISYNIWANVKSFDLKMHFNGFLQNIEAMQTVYKKKKGKQQRKNLNK